MKLLDVEDGDAIIMAQNLAKRFGLALGFPQGANFLVPSNFRICTAVRRDRTLVVTVFADDN